MHEHMFGLSDLQRREPDGLRSGHMQPVPDLWRRDAGLHAHRGQLPDLQRDDCDILHEHVQCRGPELSDVRSFVPHVPHISQLVSPNSSRCLIDTCVDRAGALLLPTPQQDPEASLVA